MTSARPILRRPEPPGAEGWGEGSLRRQRRRAGREPSRGCIQPAWVVRHRRLGRGGAMALSSGGRQWGTQPNARRHQHVALSTGRRRALRILLASLGAAAVATALAGRRSRPAPTRRKPLPLVPVSDFGHRRPAGPLEVRAQRVGHRQQGNLQDVVGNAQQGGGLPFMQQMQGGEGGA